MPTSFERNLNLCFTKIKQRHQSPPPPHPPPSHRRSKSTPIIKNFNTLYQIPQDSDDTSSTPTTPTTTTELDLSTAIASNRFFFSSPGRSNSIIESSSPSTSSLASTSFTPDSIHAAENGFVSGVVGGVGGGVAVPTMSPDPYYDFRKSMQEMMEARDDVNDARATWDYLHELLTCYLYLNPKSAHKFIVGAFADLLVTFMATENGGCRNI